MERGCWRCAKRVALQKLKKTKKRVKIECSRKVYSVGVNNTKPERSITLQKIYVQKKLKVKEEIKGNMK